MQLNYSALIIIQVMIVIESQILNNGSKAYYWSINILQKKVTCLRENFWNLRKHFDMSVRTKRYSRLGMYVVAIWSGIQIGQSLCSFGKKVILIPSSKAICKQGFSKKNAKATHVIGWTWRPLMLLCMSLFMGLKWMQQIGPPSSIFGEICKIKGFLHPIDSFLFTNQTYIFISYIISFWEYFKIQSWGDILESNVHVNWQIFFFKKHHTTLWIWSWTSNEIWNIHTRL